jgi:PAS domain S-box-containing protein
MVTTAPKTLYTQTSSASMHRHNTRLGLRFSATMALIGLAAGLAALALALLSGGKYPQLLILAATQTVIVVGAASYRLSFLHQQRQKLGAGLMLGLIWLGLLFVPLIGPRLLPSAAVALVVTFLAGQALLPGWLRHAFGLLCALALASSPVAAQDWSASLLGFSLDTARDLPGFVIIANLLLISGYLLAGYQLVTGYQRAMANDYMLLRTLIDHLPDYLFVKDRQSRILVNNAAHAWLLGKSTPDQVVGKNDFDFFPPEMAQKYYDDEQQIMANEESRINIEEPTIDPNGTRHWLLTTKVLLRNAEGQVSGIVGVSRDITTLKETELERDRLLNIEQEQRARLESTMLQMREAASRLNEAAAEILAAAAQQAESALQQEAAIAETMATVEQVRATVSQTTERAQQVEVMSRASVETSRRGQEAVTHTVDGMNLVKQRVEAIAHNILSLSERTQQIGEIIDTVNALADQSKLLALNASIEAARAGEDGKGFAVVALEVRQLAEQSRQATARVRDILNEIQQATNTSVMVTEEGSKGADRGMELVERAGHAIRDLAATIEVAAQASIEIAGSTRQQTNGMEQLTLAMNQLRQAATQTAASTRQMERSVQDLTAMAQQLELSADLLQHERRKAGIT